jgi:DNA-binding CsgD family transcriptional regulator
VSSLTPREREVLALIRQGYGPREIAQRLGIAPETARKHRDNAVRRVGAGSQIVAVRELDKG